MNVQLGHGKSIWNSMTISELSHQGFQNKIGNKPSIFFSAARGWPAPYVIRHRSIYGNSDIIAMDIFNMTSFPSVVYSDFGSPPVPQLIAIPQSGHAENTCDHILILHTYS